MKKITDTTKNPTPHWLMGGNPSAIEAQEKQGQSELVQSSQLPIKGNSPFGLDPKSQYEAIGIKVIGSSDDLFYDVELPAGWNLKPTDHPMWSHLYDHKGGNRASIFYKASFYDRDSFINFNYRYLVIEEREKDAPQDDIKIGWRYVVVDYLTKKNLFETERYNGYDNQQLKKQAKDWLKSNFPDHEDINAYW